MPIATTLSGKDEDDDHGNPGVDNGNGSGRHHTDPSHYPQR